MNNVLGWVLQGIALVLLQLRCPAAAPAGERAFEEADPAYAVYQRYRYAYDTYGYLFLSGESGGSSQHSSQHSSQYSNQYSSQQLEQQPEQQLEQQDLQSAQQSGPSASADAVSMAQLGDYDFLMRHFYSVHPSTTADRELVQAETLLGTDVSLQKDASVPQILIYHTHSQERYADYGPGNQTADVVANGAYLAELLRAKGWNVIHDTTSYDMKGGELDRNRAYTYALDGITAILQANPTVEVILDLHRDGVKTGTHLVSQINGKPTANIMFFQGMSRTPEGNIEYLPNPYLKENLAFSFQMQLAAAGSYPGLTRKIYLKGLRYNLHLRPRSALIEVGAQTNTGEEARNAMEPLAELLDMVLQGN